MLSVTKKVVFEVDYNDVDKAITDFLKSKGFHGTNFDKFGYELVAVNEWCNDEEHSINVTMELPKGIYAQRVADGKIPDTRTILNWMCADGLIESGEYLISVSW
jgi:hypothetical protein